MTLKYESEILYGLMKRDGDDSPSDVLPYESELKEKYLNQVMGAYPKLQDYRPEWLNYNLYKHLPADFPVETVSNVTEASFQNVVPYAYKSAILKGKTLVNTVKGNVRVSNKGMNVVNVIPTDKSKKYLLKFRVNKVATVLKESATQMAVKLQFFSGGNPKGYHYISNENFNVGFEETIVVEPLASGDEANFIIWIPRYESGELDIDILFIEYQDGMENWDIPYFTGMSSVKMPVLTTTGKNLVNQESLNGKTSRGIKFSVSNKVIKLDGVPTSSYGSVVIANCLEKNKTYAYSVYENGKFATSGYRLWVKYSDGTVTNSVTATTFTTKNIDITTVEFVFEGFIVGKDTHKEITIQIEKGSKLTPYEPFKSNILTVNEDVELRGIGDVQDTLDCLTGQVTERIGEVVLDGSEKWTIGNGLDENSNPLFEISVKGRKGNDKLNCDNLIVRKDIAGEKIAASTTTFGIMGTGTAAIRIKNGLKTLTEFKQWLSKNPITLQYELATTVVKTVDLTCSTEQGQIIAFMPLEGTMNVQTSSDTILPLLDMDVPVEAITQNLNSFTNTEE